MLYSKVFFHWVIFISNNGICCIKGGSNTFLATCLVVRAVVRVLISMHMHGPAYKFLLWLKMLVLPLQFHQFVDKTDIKRMPSGFFYDGISLHDDGGRSISWNVTSLNILIHDAVKYHTIIYYLLLMFLECFTIFYSFVFSSVKLINPLIW